MIRGKRVTLVPLEKSDLPVTLKWLNTADISFPLGKAYPFDLAEGERWYDANVSTGKVLVFKIIVEGVHIGNVTLDEFAPIERIARFSIYIGERAHQGQGYGRDATVAVLRYGFEQLNLHKVRLRVYGTNIRALELYESIGFRREGVLRKAKYLNGEYVDAIEMGIFRDEIVG